MSNELLKRLEDVDFLNKVMESEDATDAQKKLASAGFRLPVEEVETLLNAICDECEKQINATDDGELTTEELQNVSGGVIGYILGVTAIVVATGACSYFLGWKYQKNRNKKK